MRTLYLRNVPDEVERLERLAAQDSLSVSALAVRELTEVLRRADNALLLNALPDAAIDKSAILEGFGRGARTTVIVVDASAVRCRPASGVALAEALGCGVVTSDARLSRATGPRCPITVVPA